MTPEAPRVTLRSNLFNLKLDLERKTRKEWTVTDIATEAGLGWLTVNKLYTDDAARYDRATLERLIAFFRAQDMDVTLSDLITEEPITI